MKFHVFIFQVNKWQKENHTTDSQVDYELQVLTPQFRTEGTFIGAGVIGRHWWEQQTVILSESGLMTGAEERRVAPPLHFPQNALADPTVQLFNTHTF